MNDFETMTKLHREADRLLDSYGSALLSKGDSKFIEKFLRMEHSKQLKIIRWGIREIHPQFEEAEIAKAANMILFKIQLRPYDATAFGMGTPQSQRGTA